MKINQEMKRKIVQVAAFVYSNTYIGNFVSGQIYKGRWKQFCNPGMNCYSCPAARLACLIGAMQAVSGSMNFKLSFYVIGFVLALGVVWKSNLWFFLPVWSDSGTDLQDSISKEKIMEMAYLCKICAAGSVCRYHAGSSVKSCVHLEQSTDY